MALEKYKQKRDFNKTTEPSGKKKSSRGQLKFVVQKHAATSLHYDFRLELNGVLKSWAVPKGPSLNPQDKRLAMQVEDHPLDYRSFEGKILEGEYGGGEVIIWDRGTYHSLETDNRKESESILTEQWNKGDMKIVLDGEKLKGAYALVRMKSFKSDKNGKSWLLIKKKDNYASQKDVTKFDRSVVSNMTLEEIKEDKNAAVYGKNKASKTKGKKSKNKA